MFAHELQHGSIITDDTRELMNDEDFPLGWSPTLNSDEFGDYFQHGGSFSGAAGAFKSRLIVFPGDVEAALVINNDTATDTVTLSNSALMRQSYKDAWTHLVIQGDDQDNTFEVRLNPSDSSLLDLVVDNQTVLSSPVDVLVSLTLRGLEGNDTFIVEDLPSDIDLVLDGDIGNDVFDIGNWVGNNVFTDIQGNLTVLGGTHSGDSDRLEFMDSNGLSMEYTISGLADSQVVTIEADGFAADKLFQYDDIEDVELYTSLNPNVIHVTGIDAGTQFDLYAGLGDDDIFISDVELAATVNVFGQNDADDVSVWNVEEFAQVNVVGDDTGIPGATDTLTVGNGDLNSVQGEVDFDGVYASDVLILDDTLATSGRDVRFENEQITWVGGFGHISHSVFVEDIVLDGSASSDIVRVESLDFRIDLELHGNGADDTFLISDSAHDVDSVYGDVTVHGEDGFLQGQDSGPSVGDDRLIVYDDDNSWSGDWTLETVFAGLYGRMTKQDKIGNERLSLLYDQIEQTTLHADDGPNSINVLAMPPSNALAVYGEAGDDSIDVESTPAQADPLQVFGGPGSDTIRITPTPSHLGYLLSAVTADGGQGAPGDSDSLEMADATSGNVAPYTLSDTQLSRNGSAGVTFAAFELVTAGLSTADNHIDVTASAPGTTVLILAYGGDDTLTAENLASPVHFWGGADDDHAELRGTFSHDEVLVQGNVMTLGSGSLTTISESRAFHGRRGRDLMTFVGEPGTDELFHVQPSPKRFSGRVNVTGQTPLDYRGSEQVAIVGDAGNDDTMRFDGRTPLGGGAFGVYADYFDIHLAAEGTAKDPVMVLRNAKGLPYLTLLDYDEVGTPAIHGLLGSDTFYVTIQAGAPIDREIHLDGGSSPVGQNGDQLHVIYEADQANASWSPTSPSDGEIAVDYGLLAFLVEYENMESIELIAK